MIKSKASWGVPLSSFAIAILLAFVAGPKTALYARPPGGGTGVVSACVCDLTNFTASTAMVSPIFTTDFTYDIESGLPGDWTTTNVTYAGSLNYELKVKVRGVVTTRPIAVPMIAVPPGNLNRHFGVVKRVGIASKFTGSDAIVDAALRVARRIPNYVSDNQDTPTLSMTLTARTNDLGTVICKDTIKLSYVVPVDLLGGGSGSGTTPN